MSNNLGARSITDSAVLTVMTFIIMLIGNFLGFTILLTAMAFIPLALIYIKYNFKFWACGSIVTSILLTLFTGVINTVLLIIPVIILSIIYGYSVKKNNNGGTTLFYLMIGSVLSLMISFSIYIYVFLNMSLTKFIQTYIIDLYKPMMSEVSKLLGGTNNAYIAEMSKFLTVKNILIIIPTVLTIYAFVVALIGITIANKTLKRINFKVNEVESFDKWYIDPKVAAILVVVSIFGIILSQNGLTIGNNIIFSSMMLLFVIYSIEGLSLICFLITSNSSIKNLKILPYVLLIITFSMGSIAIFFMGILGLIDLLMDTRGINKNSLMKIIIGKME